MSGIFLKKENRDELKSLAEGLPFELVLFKPEFTDDESEDHDDSEEESEEDDGEDSQKSS